MFSYTLILSFAAASLALIVGALALYRDPRALVHRIFAVGMTALAAEALLAGLSLEAVEPLDMLAWQQWRCLAAACLAAPLLGFALGYGRANAEEAIRRRLWLLIVLLVLPLILTVFLRDVLFQTLPLWAPGAGWVLPLDWAGYVFILIMLGAAILSLLELEKTLRGSRGVLRWQIKFTVLGLGALVGARIFTASQALLYRSLHLNLELVNTGALLLAGLLLLRSLFRTRFFSAGIYVSEKVLTNSLTLLVIGIYFIAVSLLAKLSVYWPDGVDLPIKAFLLLLALVGLAVLVFSERLRRRTKLFISRNFQRPLYDYRKEWARFTRGTTAVRSVHDLCLAVTRMVSETLHAMAVTIWLVDESGERLIPTGSTALSDRELEDLKRFASAQQELIRLMTGEPDPVDLDDAQSGWSINQPEMNREFLKEGKIRYAVALEAGGRLVGLLTLDQRVAGDRLNLEDFDLLKVIADQTAAGLNQHRLAEKVQQAREMAAFQTMSTFFIHDLKNVASRLSLTMENLPIHFDNPEFRKDALTSIAHSLDKINGLCLRLSSLREKLVVEPQPGDLNQLVRRTLEGFAGALRAELVQDLISLPLVPVDAEQFPKVLTNLVLNAGEALAEAGPGGTIRVATRRLSDCVELAVTDNGPGMSEEFIKNALFLPFKTTKKQGLGIGMFQSRMIVEAHGGRIDVESQPGRGTTFRVMLPLERQ